MNALFFVIVRPMLLSDRSTLVLPPGLRMLMTFMTKISAYVYYYD